MISMEAVLGCRCYGYIGLQSTRQMEAFWFVAICRSRPLLWPSCLVEDLVVQLKSTAHSWLLY